MFTETWLIIIQHYNFLWDRGWLKGITVYHTTDYPSTIQNNDVKGFFVAHAHALHISLERKTVIIRVRSGLQCDYNSSDNQILINTSWKTTGTK